MTLEISKPLNIKTLAGYREKSRLRTSGEAAGHLYKENEDCRRGEKEVSIDDGSGGPVSLVRSLLLTSPLTVACIVTESRLLCDWGRPVTPFRLAWVGSSRRHAWQRKEASTGNQMPPRHTGHTEVQAQLGVNAELALCEAPVLRSIMGCSLYFQAWPPPLTSLWLYILLPAWHFYLEN